MSRPLKPASAGASHWAERPERGSFALMRLTAWAARKLGRRAIAPVVALIVLYFFVFGAVARRSIAEYQRRLLASAGGSRAAPELPRRFPVYRQFLAFGHALLDKLDVWQGRIRRADVTIIDNDGLHGQMESGRGQMLVGAHLGNLEICRALADKHTKAMLNVLVHSKHAEQFNRLLDEVGANGLRLFQVTELDAGVMLELHQRIERGEWLAIAGDRVPVRGGRVTAVDFLGERALLPQGPWLLAGLLRCPANVLFCVKQQGRYRVTLERLADEVSWKRGQRDAVIASWAQRYADRLAEECARAPLQWFNFFPFWNADARPRNP
jgi:predicted LPLAT superfamily acyltransferase